MSIVGSRIALNAVALLAGGAVGMLIRLKRAYRLQALLLDVLCYSVGSLLFCCSGMAIFGIWFSRSFEQGLRESFLGWVGLVPLPAWCFLALLGAFVFSARWRYWIRHRASINSVQATREDSRA